MITFAMLTSASPNGWAVWGVVVSTRWWLLVDHCVLRNWDRILVRAVKGLISRAGMMVSICPLLWQRDVKLQQTKPTKPCLHLKFCINTSIVVLYVIKPTNANRTNKKSFRVKNDIRHRKQALLFLLTKRCTFSSITYRQCVVAGYGRNLSSALVEGKVF